MEIASPNTAILAFNFAADPGFSQPSKPLTRSSIKLPSLQRRSLVISQLPDANGWKPAEGKAQAEASTLTKQLSKFSGAHGYRCAILKAQRKRHSSNKGLVREVQTPEQLELSSKRTRQLIHQILEEANASTRPDQSPRLVGDALPAAPSNVLQKILSQHRGDAAHEKVNSSSSLHIAGPAFMHAYEQQLAAAHRELPASKKDEPGFSGNYQLEAAQALAEELTREESGYAGEQSACAHALSEGSVGLQTGVHLWNSFYVRSHCCNVTCIVWASLTGYHNEHL